MQVNFNPTTSKIAFKAPKNNNATNYTYLNNQVSFGDSYNSHTRKGKFDKLIQKLGISKKEADVSLIQVFEIDSHQCSELNNMSAQMMEYYSRKCGVDPFEDLFIAKYKDSCNHPVVVFNCFSSDINDNNRIQLFVIESDMQELNLAQKAAYKMFYDNATRGLFARGSLNNPLSDLKSDDSTEDIAKKIDKIARNIQNPTWAKYCADAEKFDPVIFSADGKQKIWFNPKNI